jgi:tRNA-(MS[2]IO[6]A)-hydroxylase (MiaE)-like
VSSPDSVPDPVAQILAALSLGERLARARAERNVLLAPDARTRRHQEHVAERERENASLLEARVAEVGSTDLEEAFRPFLHAFFEHTEPGDWLEAQTWHYVGDALVRDFADILVPALDRVSAEVTRRALAERDEQESFALDEITRLVGEDPASAERVAAYARKIIGEALTQTRRALNETGALRTLLGSDEMEKQVLLSLLQRHRERLDRLGIELVD